jgi:hypothetical protein
MRFGFLAFSLPLAALLACGSGNAGGNGGTTSTASGGSGGATTTSTTTTTTSSITSTTTTTSSSSTASAMDPTGFSCSGQAAHLAADVVPILSASCASGYGCHGAATSAAGIMGQFVGRVAEQCSDLRLMIAPSDPEHSYVIHKMTSHDLCAGDTMPKNQALLADAQIQVVYDWICAGALDD